MQSRLVDLTGEPGRAIRLVVELETLEPADPSAVETAGDHDLVAHPPARPRIADHLATDLTDPSDHSCAGSPN